MNNALLSSLGLLAAIQRERGLSLLSFCQHEWLEDTTPHSDQVLATREALSAYQRDRGGIESSLLPQRFYDAYAQRDNQAFIGSQTADALTEWYSFNLEQPVHQIALSFMTEHPHFSPAQTSALVHYIASLSYLSQLRDIGLGVYLRAVINHADELRLRTAAKACLARERLFLSLSDEPLKQAQNDLRPRFEAINPADEALHKIQAGHVKAIMAEMTPPAWHALFDREIHEQHTLLHRMISRVAAEGRELAALNVPGQGLDGDVEQRFDLIKTLPLFRGLAEAALRNLLKGARLIDLEKNEIFLTQGEPLARFYVLLEGWAKSYKSAPDGEESILQLLGRRDCILDTGLTGPAVATLSAKTVTKAQILSLSLPVLKDYATRNRELAQNLLTATTQRLQRLVAQFEQITLRTAAQRVGWFLVNLHLETGLEGAPLVLPFDKSLIASYLNIKPETFSRVLKLYREKGFLIERDRVVMPDPQALCEFCDPEMAVRCCRAEAVNCAPIRATRRTGER